MPAFPARFVLLVCCLSAVISQDLQATLQTYPAPHDAFPASPHYVVTVEQNGQKQSAFVHLSKAQWRTNRSKDVSYTGFAFEGSVRVTVENRVGTFEAARVLPSSRAIAIERQGDSISFELDRSGQFAVEFDERIEHPC
jgi:hypothetical protein